MTQLDAHDEVVVSRQEVTEEVRTGPEAAVEEVHHYHHTDNGEGGYLVRKLVQAVWLVAIILEILIGFRIFLKLIAANPQSGFASFIYTITAPFLLPFAGLTSTPSAAGAVFEISSLIAMVVYALLFWLAVYVIYLIWER